MEQQQQQNDLLHLLLEMRNGAVAIDLNNKFQEVLTSVLEAAGKGELTITLSVEPSKMGMGGVVLEVSAEHKVKMKKAELPVGKAAFFVTKEGRLTRDDPAQEQMFGLVDQKRTTRQ